MRGNLCPRFVTVCDAMGPATDMTRQLMIPRKTLPALCREGVAANAMTTMSSGVEKSWSIWLPFGRAKSLRAGHQEQLL